MKILFISQYFPPEVAAGAVRVWDLARLWAGAGHSVTVLTGFPNHPTGVVHPEYRSKLWRLVYKERAGDVAVVRTWLIPLPNRRSYERMVNYTSFWLSACLTGAWIQRPDVIIATSPQLLVGLAGWWLGKVKRAPFVFEVRDLWPESIAAVGLGTSRSPFMGLLERLALFLYRSCDHLVAVTEPIRAEILKKSQIPAEKASVILNGVDLGLVPSDNGGDELRRQLGLEGKFVVAYTGTLGLAQGLKTLLEAAARLQAEFTDIVFLVVGEGADRESLVAMARAMSLGNVRFLPQQPREKALQLVMASDVCLALLRKSAVFQTVIPTKMLEYMACGKPVILGVAGEAQRVLEEAGAGLAVEPENAPALAAAVSRLYRDAALRCSMGQSGHQYVAEHFSRSATAQRYLTILEKVRQEHARPRA